MFKNKILGQHLEDRVAVCTLAYNNPVPRLFESKSLFIARLLHPRLGIKKNSALISQEDNQTKHVYNLSRILIAINNLYLNQQQTIPAASEVYLKEFESFSVDSM